MGAELSLYYDHQAELLKDKHQYSIEVADDSKMEGCGPIHRHPDCKDGLKGVPFEGDNDVERGTTLWNGFLRGATKFPNNNFAGFRKFHEDDKKGDFVWQTYAECLDEVKAVGSGLAALGLRKGQTVGICSANRPEWTLTSIAAYSQSMVCVALYDTLGNDALEYIINHAEVPVACCSAKKLESVIKIVEKCPTLKTIVQWDEHPGWNNQSEAIKPDHLKLAEAKGVRLIGYSELIKLGKEAKNEPVSPAPDDLAFIMYTSGTTGVPKGVMLTHGNVMACVSGGVRGPLALKPGDIHLSYLPLAHILETTVEAGMWSCGGTIGFFGGDVRGLNDDIKALQPTIFAGVPRVFKRIQDRILGIIGSASCIAKGLLTRNYNKQVEHVRRGEPLDQGAENFFKSRVRPNLGLSRCRLILTGAAPCGADLIEFLKVIVNPADGFCQGYGMTETAAGVACTWGRDHTMGHVGGPLHSVEIRLRDVVEMNYMSANNTGEILCRGPSIFNGYYKNDQATAETLLDGWICTGDIGRWNGNGTLSIIDRKKNIFKLAQGEYVAAEKIEQVYGQSPLVGQIFVYGNSYKTFLLAICVPNAENLLKHLKEKNLWQGPEKVSTAEFRQAFKENVDKHRDVIVADIMASLKAAGTTNKLLPFEQVKDIHVEAEIDENLQGFTVNNDLMTPTFKLKRPTLLKRYEPQLRDLYTKHGEKPQPTENWGVK